jgi:hypothetical protein
MLHREAAVNNSRNAAKRGYTRVKFCAPDLALLLRCNMKWPRLHGASEGDPCARQRTDIQLSKTSSHRVLRFINSQDALGTQGEHFDAVRQQGAGQPW